MGVWPRKGAYFLHPLKSRWIFLFPREQKKKFCRVGHAMNCFLLPSLTYALLVCLFFFLDGRMERKGGTRAEKTFYIFFWVITPSLFNRTEQEERGRTRRIWALTLSYNHHIMSFFFQLVGSDFFCASSTSSSWHCLVHTCSYFLSLCTAAVFPSSIFFSLLFILCFSFSCFCLIGFFRWNEMKHGRRRDRILNKQYDLSNLLLL